ncbi:MAG: DUF4365 domain-containing protein [Bacillota bacterium]
MANLPESSPSHDQERRSKLAFWAAIPEELFLVREETGVMDYGADYVLEARIHKTKLTNLRTHVQLKSVSTGKLLTDGSLSFPCPTKNINYLSNQPNSLFVIYSESDGVLYWEWVSQIALYAKSQGIDVSSTEQETLSYRFRQVLDRTSLEQIHHRLRTSGEITRSLEELTTVVSPTEPTTVAILPAEGIVRTPAQVAEIVKQRGVYLANSGLFKDLDRLLGQIPSFPNEDPELGVVVAYAKIKSGEYFEALRWLPRGTKLAGMSGRLRQLGEYLTPVVSYLVGIYDDRQLKSELEALENSGLAGSVLGLWSKFQRKREAVIRTDRTLVDEYQRALEELQAATDAIKTAAQGHPFVESGVALAEWELNGYQLLGKLLDDALLIQGRKALGVPLTEDEVRSMASVALGFEVKWVDEFRQLSEQGWPSRSMAASAALSFCTLQLLFASNFHEGLRSEDQMETLRILQMDLIDLAVQFEQEGDWHSTFRARLALAEAEFGLGNVNEAKRLAQLVLGEATTIGATDIVRNAERLLSGGWIFNKRGKKDHILTDDEIPMYARQGAQILGLPSDRIPNLEIDYRWGRDDEIERRSWCQHLQVLQDRRHSFSYLTWYAINPPRIYWCKLRDVYSPRPSTDRDSLLLEFKHRYCRGCDLRSVCSAT